MAKGSKARNSNKKTPQKPQSTFSDSDMDDEIDVFHKQRDIVPLDLDDDIAESDEDNDQHVFEIEDGSDDDDDDDDDEEDEDEDEDDFEDAGLAAKIAKQQKSLKAKIGGAKDETQDDDEEEDKEKKSVAWGRGKNIYYDNDKGESSEDEEEAEVLRLQNEKTKLYSNADHGLEDDDDSEEEPTFEDKLKKGKASSKTKSVHEDDMDTGVEVVMKDPSSLSKEEQMDIVYNSAPELVGLLSELNEAVDQLETKVDPILNKLKEEKNLNKPGIQYMELKKQLLLSYCQAITFHLLLKSEGHSVHDHPILARLVEIKNLLDKMKPIDENLSFEVEDYFKKNVTTTMVDSVKISPFESVSLVNNHKPTIEQKEPQVESKTVNEGKRKRENEKRGLQSVEMLKVRAALEEKLKEKGVFNLKALKKTDGVNKNLKPLNGKLEALDDFDDDTFNIEGNQNKSKLSQLVTQTKKPRVISGDDDLPKRDDIGERRRKHEVRVLASAGIQSDDDMQNDENTLEADEVDDMNEDGDTESDSESDLYKETKLKRDAKLAAKAQKYSRTAPSVAMPETSVDGKRHINYEMEKNRGLTRKRNKDIKNPRKKYKLKHKKKEVARKGQVREHRKPSGPYGGEGSGINTISRSIRFKS